MTLATWKELLADRVPLDPTTGQEYAEISFRRVITEGTERREQVWLVAGDPRRGRAIADEQRH